MYIHICIYITLSIYIYLSLYYESPNVYIYTYMYIQSKATQAKASENKTMRSKAMQSKAKQNNATQSNAKQSNAKQSNTNESKMCNACPYLVQESKCHSLGLLTAPRLWNCNIKNEDEFYGTATDFKLVTADKAKLNEVCEYQSTFNRYITTGESKRTTKTSGSIGMQSTSTTCLGGASNLHPSLSVPLFAKVVGQHTTCCIDRFQTSTQNIVQPHEDLHPRLRLPQQVSRFRYLQVFDELAEALQLQDKLDNPNEQLTAISREELDCLLEDSNHPMALTDVRHADLGEVCPFAYPTDL